MIMGPWKINDHERMKKWQKEFGIRLQKALDKEGIKPYDLAKELCMSPSTVCRYLSGEIQPKIWFVLKISEYLNLDLLELIGEY